MSAGLDQAFTLAAAELGMASAAWLYVGEAHAADGDAGVVALRDALGRRWPVADAICEAWLRGDRPPVVDAGAVIARLEGVTRLVVVGLEARWLDALARALPVTTRLGLVRASELAPDWERISANFAGRVELLEVSDFQSWAGQRSALLAFVYGGGGSGLFASSGWARVSGPDVRTQFRELIGWDVLGAPPAIYPRWLVAVSGEDFTSVEHA